MDTDGGEWDEGVSGGTGVSWGELDRPGPAHQRKEEGGCSAGCARGCHLADEIKAASASSEPVLLLTSGYTVLQQLQRAYR